MKKTKRHQITIGDRYWWVKYDLNEGHYLVSRQQEKEMALHQIMTGGAVKNITTGIYVSLMEFVSSQTYDYYKRKINQEGEGNAD